MRSSSAARVCEGTPASRSRAIADFSAERTSTACGHAISACIPVVFVIVLEFLLEALGFEVRHEPVHKRAKLAFHHQIELVEREIDAMVCDAVLREIVSADLFGAIAGLDLSAALGGDGFMLLGLLHFIETRAEHAHGLGAIFDLRFFVLL